jgi:hypothetical protein
LLSFSSCKDVFKIKTYFFILWVFPPVHLIFQCFWKMISHPRKADKFVHYF